MATSNAADTDLVVDLSAIATQVLSRNLKLANGLTAADISAKVDATQKKLKAIEVQKAMLKTLVDEKNALRKELLALRKRARAGVAGVYGDDSAEYQAVGGVRVSERKKPGRKPK